MNNEHRAWTNPFTGVQSNASFVDVFEKALGEYPQVAGAFFGGEELVGFDMNYSGQVLGA